MKKNVQIKFIIQLSQHVSSALYEEKKFVIGLFVRKKSSKLLKTNFSSSLFQNVA